MRTEEAAYIREQSYKYLDIRNRNNTILNLGSSTLHFRTVDQPHIDQLVFQPLREIGVRIIHSDLKSSFGVDVPGDIFDPQVQSILKKVNPDVVLMSNMMEHLEVNSRNRLPMVLDNIVPVNGILIVTVPYSFPLHFDPIDTYYRPSPSEIASAFPNYISIDQKIIKSCTYLHDLRSSGLSMALFHLLRLFLPFYKFRSWVGRIHRLSWLFRPYQISYVALRRVY